MKSIKYFYLKNCPYCIQASNWLEELFEENPEYKTIPLTRIEETKEPHIAEQHNYYYVPTFYVDADKLHEGIASKDKIKAVLDAALEG